MSKEQETKEQTVFTESNAANKGDLSAEGDTSIGLKPNLAAALCYFFFFGFVLSIIFLIMEKKSNYVRFHAMQSILLTVALAIVFIVLSFIPLIGWLISLLLAPVLFFVWLFLMYKAYNEDVFKLPIVGDMAEQQVIK